MNSFPKRMVISLKFCYVSVNETEKYAKIHISTHSYYLRLRTKGLEHAKYVLRARMRVSGSNHS